MMVSRASTAFINSVKTRYGLIGTSSEFRDGDHSAIHSALTLASSSRTP